MHTPLPCLGLDPRIGLDWKKILFFNQFSVLNLLLWGAPFPQHKLLRGTLFHTQLSIPSPAGV